MNFTAICSNGSQNVAKNGGAALQIGDTVSNEKASAEAPTQTLQNRAPSGVAVRDPNGITGLRRHERIVIIATWKLSLTQRVATKEYAVLLTPGTSG